jgi:tetratricopeptide (TPR) repeat protein
MDLEFLFSAAVGAAITEAVFEKLEKVKSFCTQCGKEIQTGASFCSYCGAKVLKFAEGVKTMYLKAVDYHNGGKYREAISILEKLIELDRSNPIIYMQLWNSWGRLAFTHRDNKNIFLSAVDRVFEYYEVILQLDRQGISLPADVLAEIKEYTPIFQTYKDILTGKKHIQSKKGEEYEHKANLAEKAGNHREALRCFTKAIEVETSDFFIATYHVRRALIKRVLGDYTGALSECEIALECERLNDEMRKVVKNIRNSVKAGQYGQESLLAAQAQNGKKALQCIAKAIELETNDALLAQYHVQRASIRGAIGDYTGALSDCRMALECEELGDGMKEIAREIQHSVENRQDVNKKASKLKSASERVRTRSKADVRKGRKRAI